MRRNKKDSEMNSHARVRATLLSIYGYLDMLTGQEIPNFKAASYHHLDKDEFGGEYTVDNGAIFLRLTHDFIHNVIEAKDPELFDLLTECLILYKYCLLNNKIELVEQFQKEVQPQAKRLVLSYKTKRK